MAKDAFNDIDQLRSTINGIVDRMKRVIQRQQQGYNESQTEVLEGLADQLQQIMNFTRSSHEPLRQVILPSPADSSNDQ
ncbi:uncharacterized protein N7482_010376 [Penicillium canariense]|uniref:Uncharacterized protein n=1 Tax=Penicillium canariense TaxID=189055 RepID=A0A9W9HP12_9EURO|nr:uncharacterized protein N7482_010376 [Penicillium canariense]KAJ5151124.1 hypothetical protein N7482_010376 [Penicillium canariense]